MTIQLEEGKWYARADGSVHGPARSRDSSRFPWFIGGATYTDEGFYYGDQPAHPFNLVREVPAPGAEIAPVDEMDSLDQLEAELQAEEDGKAQDPLLRAMIEDDIVREPTADIKTYVADEAKRIVTGARRSAYGTPEQNFERIARFWQAYFENTGRGAVQITARDVSPLMRLMKEARLAESPEHLDSFVDLIGYTLTGAEVNGVKPPSA